jgi:hypothetical protein
LSGGHHPKIHHNNTIINDPQDPDQVLRYQL